MLRNGLEPAHLLLLLLVFMVAFGWKRLPDMARSLGRSARIFKSEVDQMKTDDALGLRSNASDTGTGVPRTDD